MDETLTELVLRAVELVPPGRLVSYGDVAALLGTGPRQVGAVMAREGHGVQWWRVTNASGDPGDGVRSVRCPGLEGLGEEGLEGIPAHDLRIIDQFCHGLQRGDDGGCEKCEQGAEGNSQHNRTMGKRVHTESVLAICGSRGEERGRGSIRRRGGASALRLGCVWQCGEA